MDCAPDDWKVTNRLASWAGINRTPIPKRGYARDDRERFLSAHEMRSWGLYGAPRERVGGVARHRSGSLDRPARACQPLPRPIDYSPRGGNVASTRLARGVSRCASMEARCGASPISNPRLWFWLAAVVVAFAAETTRYPGCSDLA